MAIPQAASVQRQLHIFENKHVQIQIINRLFSIFVDELHIHTVKLKSRKYTKFLNYFCLQLAYPISPLTILLLLFLCYVQNVRIGKGEEQWEESTQLTCENHNDSTPMMLDLHLPLCALSDYKHV